MANPLAPNADGWDTVPRPMGPWEAQFAQYLQPDPNTTYGSVLPIARDNTTGAMRLALPSSVRDLAQGALQLIDGPATGGVTPQATMALASLPVTSGVTAGVDATGNALASGPFIRAYHGGPGTNPYDDSAAGLMGVINKFRLGPEGGAFFSADPELASDYAIARYPERPAVYPVDLDQSAIHTWDQSQGFKTNQQLMDEAKANGKSVVQAHNQDDSTPRGHRKPTTVYIALDPSAVRMPFADN